MSELNIENYEYGLQNDSFDASPASKGNEEELRAIWAKHLTTEKSRSEEEYASAHPLQLTLGAQFHLFH